MIPARISATPIIIQMALQDMGLGRTNHPGKESPTVWIYWPRHVINRVFDRPKFHHHKTMDLLRY
jgi:hypothetical protein